MDAGFSIRDARAEDAADVARMARLLARVTMNRPGDMTARAVRRDLLGADGHSLIVAEAKGRAVAYALYSAAYETAYAAHGLYLSDIFVEEGQRGRGIGRAMMAELARRCRDGGGRFLWWVSVPGNAAARAFYDRLGAISDPVEARAVVEAPFEALLGG